MNIRQILQSVVIGLVVVGSQAAGVAASPSERELVLQAPSPSSVHSVAVSPDGKLVAAASGEGQVRFHDAKTGTLLRGIEAAGDRSVVFSPDGKTFAAAGFHMDKVVKLVDTATGNIVGKFTGHSQIETYATAISPDGTRLASACRDHEILVWDVPTGKLVYRIDDAPSISLAFSPDGKLLAGGGNDHRIRLWDAGTGRLQRTLTGHGDSVVTIAFSPDGAALASGSCDWVNHRGRDMSNFATAPPPCVSQLKLWDVASGESKRSVDEPGRLLSLAFAPDGKSLACAIGRTVRRYDLVANAPGSTAGRFDFDATCVAYTPDGAALVCGSHDQSVQRVAVATGQVEWQSLGTFEQVNSLAVSADGSLLVTGSGDRRFAIRTVQCGDHGIGSGAARLWDARTGRLLRRFGESVDQVMAVAVSPDGKRIAVGGANKSGQGVVQVCDVAGRTMWSATDHAKEVVAVTYSPDRALLATAGADGTVLLRDAGTFAARQTLSGHDGGATSVAFSSDGALVACGEGHGGLRVWDAKSGRHLNTCLSPDSKAPSVRNDRLITSIAFIPGSEQFYACAATVGNTFSDPVRLWDARTGAMTLAPPMAGRPITLSRDGKVLAAGGKGIQLYELPAGKKLHRLGGYLKKIQSIAFSSDGRFVYGGGSYGTPNIWDAASGRLLLTLFAFPEEENGVVSDQWVAYRPDGYFDGSPGAERYLAWRVGDEFQTAARQPDRRRPDLVQLDLRPGD